MLIPIFHHCASKKPWNLLHAKANQPNERREKPLKRYWSDEKTPAPHAKCNKNRWDDEFQFWMDFLFPPPYYSPVSLQPPSRPLIRRMSPIMQQAFNWKRALAHQTPPHLPVVSCFVLFCLSSPPLVVHVTLTICRIFGALRRPDPRRVQHHYRAVANGQPRTRNRNGSSSAST